MANQEFLISRITQLSEDKISSVLNAVTLIPEDKELMPKPDCPCWGSSHYHAFVWKEMVTDTLHGNAIPSPSLLDALPLTNSPAWFLL